jgi:hypothetical protein
MKKFLTPFIISLLFVQPIKSQTTPNSAINKGNISTTPYFGFPNFLTASLKNVYELADHKKDQLTIKGSVPVGIAVSYLIKENLAIGGEIGYESTEVKWRENETLMGNDSTNFPYIHNYFLKASRTRILIILNYHFVIRKRSDWYIGFGLGYNHTFAKLHTNAPNIGNYDSSSCFFPVSVQTKLGFNYYFTKNIAFHADAGIGGPLVSIGITGKF